MPRHDKPIPEFPTSDKVSLDRKFFLNLRDRLETIVPKAGKNIEIKAVTGGYGLEVSVCFGSMTQISLNVCSNGTPSVIKVFGMT